MRFNMLGQTGLFVSELCLGTMSFGTILGAKSVKQLEDHLKAVAIRLSADEVKKLDDASALPTEYPG